jgi:hypothetical protein
VTIEICKQIASELENRYMEIMDDGGDQSEADSVGTPFKDGHLAIEFALKEIERLTAERDEARRMYCKAVADHYEYACNAELDGAGPYTQKDAAKDEGWDCFKEEK